MKLMRAEPKESCVARGFIFIYSFDRAWEKAAVKTLGALGKMRYFGEFPKPLFEIKCADKTLIRGVEGTQELTVIFARSSGEGDRRAFEKRCAAIVETL